MKAVVVLKEIKRCGGRSPMGRLQPGLSRTRLYFNQSSTPRYFQPFQPISVFLSSSISKSRENTKIASDYHTRLIWNILKMGKHQDQQTHHTLDQKLTTRYIQQSSAGKKSPKNYWLSEYISDIHYQKELWDGCDPLRHLLRALRLPQLGGGYGWE